MDALYMEAAKHHSGHISWIIHKTKKAALTSAKFGVQKCGIKEAKVFRIEQIEGLGWHLRTELEPTPINIKDWIEIAHFEEEVEQ